MVLIRLAKVGLLEDKRHAQRALFSRSRPCGQHVRPLSSRRMTTHDSFGDGGALHAIFHPTTVAVIGATAEPDTLGHKALAGLTAGGFESSVVAVDSRQQSNVFGVRVYRELEDVPGPVDLAVVVTSSDATFEAIERCAACGSERRSGPVRARWERGSSARLRAPRPRAAAPKPDEADWPRLLRGDESVARPERQPRAADAGRRQRRVHRAERLAGDARSSTGATRASSGSAHSCRSATWSTSGGGISSITSAPIRPRARFSFTWSRSPTCGRSCRRPAPSRCGSRSSSPRPAARKLPPAHSRGTAAVASATTRCSTRRFDAWG